MRLKRSCAAATECGADLFSFVEYKSGNGLDRAGSGLGVVAGSCESGNELSGSINSGEYLV